MLRFGRRPFYRGNRSEMQLQATRRLAVHPHRLELRGRPRSLAWPPVCAYCGEQAAERITVRKAFARPRAYAGLNNQRTRTHFRGEIVTAARVPFCARCAGEHRATVQRITLMRRVRTIVLTPLLIPLVGTAYVFSKTLPKLSDLSFGAPGALAAWGLPAAMAFGFVWCLFLAWITTRSSRVESQTNVALACDFSDDVSRFFERERHIYAIRDANFFTAFASANRDRVWSESDDARSSGHTLAIIAMAGIAAVAVWLWVVFAP